MAPRRTIAPIAVIVRTDLADWQKLNVTAFLSSGVAHATDEIVGKPYEDDNRAAIRAVEADALDLVGLAVYGPRNQVDKVTRGLRLHG
ncbi:DUF2000 domain-containing protein [Streptomyces malaysiensis]|uniref:DUF2000 domain-containing protein n=1 Tax=Streptomyces malaysiensis subsp. samsunensis TaxID=459658 RepID=A0A9X2LVM9_STRMQ|nr:DUF2000 domain-containing protein [Streptomyces samsunensis]MCQ8830598.1 DUF2000 domain-containing protein [Streptomyces samsunensis]